MFDLILCALTIVIGYWLIHSRQYPKCFPPGPRHFLPFIGDPIFAIGSRDGVSGFRRMHKKFGPVVGFNFGGMKVVSINDFDLLQKVTSRVLFVCFFLCQFRSILFVCFLHSFFLSSMLVFLFVCSFVSCLTFYQFVRLLFVICLSVFPSNDRFNP